jgi:choline dehydrogenase-like flavoprotein
MKQGFSDYTQDQEWTADVCIIGAGAGGSATACALAEAGLEVLVLEAGSHWSPSQFKQDSAWAYRNLYDGQGARSAVGNCVIPIPGGRGVGGSTLINSAICFKTPDTILEQWSGELGCSRLTVEAMAPKLDRVWTTIGATINPPEVQRDNNRIFKKGADALGLPGQWLHRSAPGCIGCGVCHMGCPTGGKSTVDRTFLAQALLGGHARVHADCRVEGVQTEGGKVMALTGRTIDPETLSPAGRFTVRARAFVSCAGPIGSPRFLLRNGLSDDSVCGQRLYIHPTCGLMARFEERIKPWHGVTQGFCVDRWDRGYLLQTFSVSPDQMYTSMPYSMGMTGLEAIRDMAHIAMAGALVHDEDSQGSVGLKTLTYWLGDGDRKRLLAGMRETARVFFAAGALEVYTGIVGSKPIKRAGSIDEQITDDVAARDLFLYASHPMSTCSMGDTPERSVIDPDGRVWGWDNLFVADASVFPTSLGVNPQVTTMAVGLTIGEAVAERLG